MKKEELEQFKNTQAQIPADIKRVLKRITRIQEVDGKKHSDVPKDNDWRIWDGDSAQFFDMLDHFRIEGKWCYWETETNPFVEGFRLHQKCEGRFLAKRLCMADEELDAWADERIASIKLGRERTRLRMEAARQKREKRKAAKREKEERALYERLKQKYG